MFGWRKKRDGFEWRSYVKTTILVKRKQRKDKLEEAKQAALDGLSEVGKAGAAAGQSGVEAARRGLNVAAREAQVAGGKAARGAVDAGKKIGKNVGQGLGIAGKAAREGAIQAGAGLWKYSRIAGNKIGNASGAGLVKVSEGLGDVGRAMSPRVSLPLVIAAIAASIGAIARTTQNGFDAVAITACVIAAVLIGLSLLPLIGGRASLSAPFSTRRYSGAEVEAQNNGADGGQGADYAGLGKVLAAVLVGGVVIGVGVLIAPLLYSAGSSIPVSMPDIVSSRSETIEGKAKALSGDVMLVGGEKVVLRGVEAPDLSQKCKDKRGRDWRCGRSALSALRRITGYETIVCEVTGTDSRGRNIADCMVGEKNIAAELVKDGVVFAGTGFLRAYGSEETEAREAKRGIWQGEAKRPSETGSQ